MDEEVRGQSKEGMENISPQRELKRQAINSMLRKIRSI